MKIRKAGTADLESIVLLEETCFPREAWPKETFRKELKSSCAMYLLAVKEDKAAGYISCWLRKEERYAHITSLAVRPDCQRQGIGEKLLIEMLHRCGTMGIQSYRAETRLSSRHVAALFKKHGFYEMGILTGYYGSPPEDAVLLMRIPENS